ncbi:MAG: nucleotidyltransferase domain-containing protein [Promethearchaeota archaeon]
MTGNKNIQERFENFISSLSIPKHIRVDLQRAVLKLVENLKKVGNPIIFPIQQTRSKIRNVVVLRGHQFGGSYDRGTYVKNFSDIDVYVVYEEQPAMERLKKAMDATNKGSSQEYKGEILLKTLRHQLKKIRLSIRRDLEVRNPPYRHAIKTKMRYANKDIKMDLVPAIDLHEDGNLLIPNTNKRVVKVNPTKEENALKKLNNKSDGKGTKMIRLIKAWNNHWQSKIISYILERLVLEIFKNKPIGTWVKALRTFYNESIRLINERAFMPDKIYSHKSILDEYNQSYLLEVLETLKKAKGYADKSEWSNIFGMGRL